MSVLLINGNALQIPLADNSVHCVVTSPPYWSLRDYGVDGQLGLEQTPEEYVANMVAVFREVRRVLRPDGVVFLNLGDSYYSEQSSSKRVIIREDLTLEETYEAALGIRRYMPELWRTCWQETGEGALCEVLSEEIQSRTPRKNARNSEGLLPPQSEEVYGSDKEKMGRKKGGSDSADGREVCLLRGNGADVSLSGSYQGEWTPGLREDGRTAWGLEEGNSRGIAEGQISPSLLELQFGIRFIRFLSTLKLDFSDIPFQLQVFFKTENGLKPKDLCIIPARLALALQADGWWLRSDIIWSKPNPMPESVTDRPTKAHEYLFLLAKSQRYYYDADAVREPLSPTTANDPRMNDMGRTYGGKGRQSYGESGKANGQMEAWQLNPAGRNRRTVWEIATAPYSGAHFATYPPALVEPCIKAGTSERGVCPVCGAGWRRVVDVNYTDAHRGMVGNQKKVITDNLVMHSGRENDKRMNKNVSTLGWQPACNCQPHEPIPATVFDPFAGSGTTLMVARKLGRNGVGIDLSLRYLVENARQRLELDRLDAWEAGVSANGDDKENGEHKNMTVPGSQPHSFHVERVKDKDGKVIDDLPLFKL